MYLLPIILLLSVISLHAKPQVSIARYGDIKYRENFKNFDYVNPDAPKGGSLNLGVLGTFDSTNPFITKGTPPVGLSLFSEMLVFETLMRRSCDEPFTLYGLIAKSCDIAPDNSFIIFNIDSRAKWADGRPITGEDVIFSHNILKTKGRLNLRLFYGLVQKAEILTSHSVKFYLKPKSEGKYDTELPLLIAGMSIIPKHIYEHKDFEKVCLEKVIGSGPYEIITLKAGNIISYRRRLNYWGKDLPTNKGKYNFDQINVIYYREPNVALMAFAAGNYDVKVETNPTTWFRNYNFNAVRSGQILKQAISHQMPVGMTGYCFNQRRNLFKNRDVRHALALIFPFETINKNLFYNSFVRNKSYYDNSELASKGLPSIQEKNLLQNYQNDFPVEVLTQTFDPTDGLNQNERINKARQLLASAGWIVKGGKLVHPNHKSPFEFELLLFNKEEEKVALAYARELKKLGIHLFIRTIDTAQFESRRLKLDFDCIAQTWGGTLSPGNEQTFYWNSTVADTPGSRNYAGIKNLVVDDLCKKILEAHNREDLKIIAHALDRVLLWEYLVVPLYYNPKRFLAYWNKLDHPPFNDRGLILFQNWWQVKRHPQDKR